MIVTGPDKPHDEDGGNARPKDPKYDNPLREGTSNANQTVGDSSTTGLLTEISKAMMLSLKASEQEVFRACVQKSRREVHDQVKSGSRKTTRYTIYAACRDFLQFYVPLHLESPFISKYWGAVSKLITTIVGSIFQLLRIG